jgi:HlyD family secretion protein
VDRQLQEGVLIAPTAGEILLRSVEPGEVVQPGQACLKIGDLARMELKVYLSETDIDLIKVGGKLPVLVDALNGEPLEGVVSWISSEAEFTPKNAQTRDARTQLVYAIKLRIPNPDGKLHIGMPAELELGKR